MLSAIIIWLCSKVLVVVVLLHADGCNALRMINLDAPGWANQGDTIELSCSFTLEQHKQRLEPKYLSERFNLSSRTEVASEHQKQQFEVQEFASSEQLYAIKWFKDGREFFRYLSDEWPRKQPLSVDGVTLAEDKSDNHTVVLRNVSLKTSGLYRCEVTTDAPSFVTKSLEKRMRIYSLPLGGPKIEVLSAAVDGANEPKESILNEQELKEAVYMLGSKFMFTCTAPDSKPAASLHWIINDSLNLSTLLPAQLDGIRSSIEFSLQNRRFIRPSIISASTTGLSSSVIINKSRIGGGKQQQEQPQINNHSKPALTYELLNDTLALPIQEHNSLAVPINLSANLLDQLTESSSSRLNLSVDSNLFRFLQASSRPKLAFKHPPTPSTTTAQMPQLDKVTAKSITSKSAETNNTSSLSYATQIVSSQVDKEAPLVTHKNRQRLPNSQGASLRSDPSGKRKHWIVRVKCIARALHLVMSDEVKLRFTYDQLNNNENDYFLSVRKNQPVADAKNLAVSHHSTRGNQIIANILTIATTLWTELVYLLVLK